MTALARYGAELSSADRWKSFGPKYVEAINGPYHRHRLAVISALLPDLTGKKILDFGCGNGAMIEPALAKGAASAIGIDPDEGLLVIARDTHDGQFIRGGAEAMRHLFSVDCIIAANVLAFMTDTEEAEFYQQAARLLPSGGYLLVSHSNELFDLFTLNAYTATFFRKNFSVDPSALLEKPNLPKNVASFNIRENPLTYPQKLRNLGFMTERVEYANYHETPPLLGGDDADRTYRDTLDVDPSERWKLMFQCSMFATLATRQ